MSCERYQRLLHLNRPGEISGQEAEELRQHVRLCERCALELQRIERADRFVNRLTAFSPSPGDPEKLTADILRGVRIEATTPRTVNSFHRFLDFFQVPSVRYSSVAIVLLVATTFMAQLITVLNDISDLERRMTSPARNEAVEATYTMRSKTLREVAQTNQGQTLQGEVSLVVTNDQIDVPVKNVDALLSGVGVKNLPAIIAGAALHIDKKTLEKIVNEIKATAELSFRVRHEGV